MFIDETGVNYSVGQNEQHDQNLKRGTPMEVLTSFRCPSLGFVGIHDHETPAVFASDKDLKAFLIMRKIAN